MPLRAQLESSPETIGDLMVAAEQRYREGQALFTEKTGIDLAERVGAR